MCISFHLEIFSKDVRSTLPAVNLYIENKGQFTDQNGKKVKDLKYYIQRSGLNIQLLNKSFSYESYHKKSSTFVKQPSLYVMGDKRQESDMISAHRVDIELVGCKENPKILAEKMSNDYLNSYKSIDGENLEIIGIYGYEKITYKDIWPNIDMEFIIDQSSQPEFQFVVRPGGNPDNIKIKYKGALSEEIIDNSLVLGIVNGTIVESIPISYTLENNLEIMTSYVNLEANIYSYKLSEYDSAMTLIIDPIPERVWATYYGGSNSDIILSTAVASDGSIYISGKSNSTNFIATTGSHQSSFAGNFDAFVSKQSASGNRLWATYYGGSGEDIGFSVVCDNSSNVYLGGQTNSSSGIATTGSHQSTFAGNADGFIVKFNSSGTRSWGTYYGGDQYEYAYLASDGTNIFIAGRTESATAIATAGAYQTSIAGLREAFLAKFTASGARVWGTYIGGSDHDYLYSVKCDQSGNVLVAGGTSSSTGIATSGAHQTVNNGGMWDSFLMQFNTNGNIVWGTYYGGSSGDMAWNISTDNNSNIYVSGITESSNSISTSGSHQTNYGGGPWDAFVVKFNSNGVRQWGTYYGGNGDESSGYGGSEFYPPTISCDNTGNILFSGNTTSSDNIATNDGYDNTYNGMKDAFFVKLTSSGQREWGTYYGSTSDDQATTIATDVQDVYIAGTTSSTSSISSTGALQTAYGGGTSDGFVVKFNTSVPQTITTSISKLNYCKTEYFQVTYTITGNYTPGNSFTVQLSNATGSFSNPTVIGSVNATTNGSINCVIPSSTPFGSGYRIRVVSSNPVVTGADNGNNITINPIPNSIISGTNSVCQETLYNYSLPTINGRTYQWITPSKGIIIGSTNSNIVNVKWTNIGTDTLKVRETIAATGCFNDANYLVTINSLPNPLITGLQQVCFKQSNVIYSVPNVPGFSYQWYQPTKGTIVGAADGNSCYINWNVTTGLDSLKLRQTNLTTGCYKDVAMSVLINPLPTPIITGSSNVCTNQTGSTYIVSFVTGHTYQWFNPSLGQIVTGGNSNVVTINWRSFSGVELLKVRQTNNSTGCFTDTTIIVNVNLTPSPVISGSNSVCLNQKDVAYSVPNIPGQTYEWFNPVKGLIVSGKYSNSCSINWTVSKGSDFIKVRQTNSMTGCYKDTLLYVTINDTPSPMVLGLNTVCLGTGDSKYSATFVPGHTYQWSAISNGTIISTTNSSELIIRWDKKAGIDTVKLTQTDPQTGCSTSQSYIVTINPSPNTNVLGPKEVCENQQQVVFRTSNNIGSSYTWEPESGNIFIQGSNGRDSVIANFSNKGVALLRLKVMNSLGCEKDTVISINVNTNIQPQITTDDNKFVICKGSTKKIATSLFGDTYIWKLNGVNIQNANTREITISKGGSYSVNVISKNCGGESNAFVIVELPNPTPSIIGNQSVLPQSKSVAYQVNNSAGSQYTWSISGNGKIVSTQAGSVILVDFTDIGNAIVTVNEVNSNGCVEDTSLNVSITNSTSVDGSFDNSSAGLEIYPNPVERTGHITLEYPVEYLLKSINITDIVGRSRFLFNPDLLIGSKGMVGLDIENLNSGVYNLIIKFENSIETIRFIVN